MELTSPDAQARLAAFIAQATGAEAAEISRIERLSGGALQENWLLEVELRGGARPGRHGLVLRTTSPQTVVDSLPREQEYAVLRAAHAAGVTVPEPIGLCEDPEVIGKAFYLARRVEGTAAPHRLMRDARLGGPREALVERIGEELGRLHTVAPPREDLSFLELPRPGPALYRVEKYRRCLDEHRDPRPVLEWGLRWLELNAPPREEVVLCHRDFRTGNVMVDANGITGILDWEFAAWSDPMEDIGWFCARCWRFGNYEQEAGGLGDRAAFYRGYERASGRTVDPERVRWWEVMAHVRWAIIALQQGDRHLSGVEPSLELALTGRLPPQMEWEVLAMTSE